MLADILLAFAVAYSLKIIILGIAVFNARYPFDRAYQPTVSIIIAARNEERNIQQCLESMIRLSYPTRLLEIVVVDDRSEDRTSPIVRTYADQFSHIRLHTVTDGTEHLRGKANAVAQGIERSTGEILLFTDADCSVPVHWVEETVKYYTDSSIGIVAGFTALSSNRMFESIQALDWFVLFSVAAATVRLNYPVTAVGNNLSVRRQAYERTGGYHNIPFSVTEDYALFHAIVREGFYRVRFPLDANTLVDSEPCKNWKELFRQKKRWFTGGKGMDLKSLLVFTIPFLFDSILLLAVFVAPLPTTLCVFIIKVLVDFALVASSLAEFKRWSLVKHFPLFEIYYTLYVLLFPIIVLFDSEVIWKEQTFKE